MTTKKGSGFAIPLVIIGATIFGVGAYHALRPKPVEINPTFQAVENPRTMQAPPAPVTGKDAAQLAAEESATKDKADDAGGSVAKLRLDDTPWLKSIMGGVLGEFRSTVLSALQKEQSNGTLNCSPTLTQVTDAKMKSLEEVACTAKDGTTFSARFDADGDGALEVKSQDKEGVTIEKSGGSFSVTVDEP